MLDHLVDDIKKTVGLAYHSDSLYEKSHKKFKECCQLTSQRKETVMYETLRRQDDRNILEDCFQSNEIRK